MSALEATPERSSLQRALLIPCLVLIVAAGIGARASVWSAWERSPEHGFYKGAPVLRECDGYHYLALAHDIRAGGNIRPGDTAVAPGPRPSFPPFLSLLAAGLSLATGASLEWCAAWIPVVLGVSATIPLYLLGAAFGGWGAGVVACLLGTMAPMWVYRTGFAFFDTDCLIVPLSLWIAWTALRHRDERVSNHGGRLISTALPETCKRLQGTPDARKRPASNTAVCEQDSASLKGINAADGVPCDRLHERWSKSLLFGAVWACACGLLLLSWDSNTVVVVYLSTVPALLSLATGMRSLSKFWLILPAGVILAAMFASCGGSFLFQEIDTLSGIVLVHDTSPFPNPSLFISELKRHDFAYVARMASGSILGLLAGVAGLVLVARSRWRQGIVLLPIASIGTLSFFSGMRFIMFLTPILALGTGVLASAGWRRLAATRWRWAVPAVVVLLSGLTLINEISDSVIWPHVHPGVMKGIEAAGKVTPEDSLIWCGWSMGYPIAYLSGRTPVADGGSGGNGQTLVSNSIPLATEDFRLSANWIQFYANRGEQGLAAFWSRSGGPAEKLEALKAALAAGPAEAAGVLAAAGLREPPEGSRSWEAFLFPRSNRRIFLFLDHGQLRSFYSWYQPGSWRPGHLPGERGPYAFFQGVQGSGRNITNERMSADLQQGIAFVDTKRLSLSEVFVQGREREQTRTYRESGPRLDVYLPGGLAVVAPPELTRSVFHRLFVRHQPDNRYFKPVLLDSPLYQLWEVIGDLPEP